MFSQVGPGALFLFLCSILGLVTAAITNRTIDDTLGDSVTGAKPFYLPLRGAWADATCRGCAVQPNPQDAFKGTWTAATYNPSVGSISVELNFKGTAIYVFFILANDAGRGITTATECNFTMDGQSVGSFRHNPSSSTDMIYNALVYSNRSLTNNDHKLIMSTSGIDHSVFLNFDYAMYTVDDPSVSSTSTSRSPSSSSQATSSSADTTSFDKQIRAIAGGIAGSLAAILVIVLVFLYWHRRKRRRAHARGVFYPDPKVLYYPHGSNPPFNVAGSMVFAQQHSGNPASELSLTGGPAPSTMSRSSTMYDQKQYSNHLPSMVMSHRSDDLEGALMPNTTSGFRGPTALSAPTSPPAPIDAVRRARQMELDRQVSAIKRDMKALKTLKSEMVRGDDVDVVEMREQIGMMQVQIETLRSEQQSEWGQGLTDEAPPGYTAASAARRSSTMKH